VSETSALRPKTCALGCTLLTSRDSYSGLPSPYGLIAHIELSEIADHIVSTTYAIAPQDGQQAATDNVGPPFRMLKEWRDKLPEHMRFPYTTPAEESYEVHGLPLDRSLLMLHMKWNQVRVSHADISPFSVLCRVIVRH